MMSCRWDLRVYGCGSQGGCHCEQSQLTYPLTPPGPRLPHGVQTRVGGRGATRGGPVASLGVYLVEPLPLLLPFWLSFFVQALRLIGNVPYYYQQSLIEYA